MAREKNIRKILVDKLSKYITEITVKAEYKDVVALITKQGTDKDLKVPKNITDIINQRLNFNCLDELVTQDIVTADELEIIKAHLQDTDIWTKWIGLIKIKTAFPSAQESAPESIVTIFKESLETTIIPMDIASLEVTLRPEKIADIGSTGRQKGFLDEFITSQFTELQKEIIKAASPAVNTENYQTLYRTYIEALKENIKNKFPFLHLVIPKINFIKLLNLTQEDISFENLPSFFEQLESKLFTEVTPKAVSYLKAMQNLLDSGYHSPEFKEKQLNLGKFPLSNVSRFELIKLNLADAIAKLTDPQHVSKEIFSYNYEIRFTDLAKRLSDSPLSSPPPISASSPPAGTPPLPRRGTMQTMQRLLSPFHSSPKTASKEEAQADESQDTSETKLYRISNLLSRTDIILNDEESGIKDRIAAKVIQILANSYIIKNLTPEELKKLTDSDKKDFCLYTLEAVKESINSFPCPCDEKIKRIFSEHVEKQISPSNIDKIFEEILRSFKSADVRDQLKTGKTTETIFAFVKNAICTPAKMVRFSAEVAYFNKTTRAGDLVRSRTEIADIVKSDTDAGLAANISSFTEKVSILIYNPELSSRLKSGNTKKEYFGELLKLFQNDDLNNDTATVEQLKNTIRYFISCVEVGAIDQLNRPFKAYASGTDGYKPAYIKNEDLKKFSDYLSDHIDLAGTIKDIDYVIYSAFLKLPSNVLIKFITDSSVNHLISSGLGTTVLDFPAALRRTSFGSYLPKDYNMTEINKLHNIFVRKVADISSTVLSPVKETTSRKMSFLKKSPSPKKIETSKTAEDECTELKAQFIEELKKLISDTISKIDINIEPELISFIKPAFENILENADISPAYQFIFLDIIYKGQLIKNEANSSVIQYGEYKISPENLSEVIDIILQRDYRDDYNKIKTITSSSRSKARTESVSAPPATPRHSPITEGADAEVSSILGGQSAAAEPREAPLPRAPIPLPRQRKAKEELPIDEKITTQADESTAGSGSGVKPIPRPRPNKDSPSSDDIPGTLQESPALSVNPLLDSYSK